MMKKGDVTKNTKAGIKYRKVTQRTQIPTTLSARLSQPVEGKKEGI
jgi:hypothetical protein